MRHASTRAALIGAAVLLAVVVAACSSDARKDAKAQGQPVATAAPSAEPAYGGPPSSEVAAQVRDGAQTFARTCAACHGASGQGGRGPALIGAGALPTNPPPGAPGRRGAFRSAKDIGMYIKDYMPQGSSTPPAQTAGLLAYLLQSNGVTPTQAINPAAAGAIPWNR